MSKLNVKRINKKFQPDCSRVIIKSHIPHGKNRIEKIITRVLKLSEKKAQQILNNVIANFSNRHKNIWDALDKHYNEIKNYLPENIQIPEYPTLLLFPIPPDIG